MSGFFALRRSAPMSRLKNELTPMGYKVGLELMCKCRRGSVREVPIHFDTRSHGESKLTLREQFRYLEHLSRLYDFYYPRASPMLKFLIATGLSWLVAFAVYVPLVPLFAPRRGRLLVPALTYPIAILTTAVFHFRYVRAAGVSCGPPSVAILLADCRRGMGRLRRHSRVGRLADQFRDGDRSVHTFVRCGHGRAVRPAEGAAHGRARPAAAGET